MFFDGIKVCPHAVEPVGLIKLIIVKFKELGGASSFYIFFPAFLNSVGLTPLYLLKVRLR
jgi:hypothetical protein